MVNLSPMLEDYLERIYFLSKGLKVVRIRDLTSFFNVKAPTALEKIKTLSELKLVAHQKYGYVELTDAGEKIAKTIVKKHNSITKFFEQVLGLPHKKAEQDACIIEHYLSKDAVDRIIKFLDFVENCPKCHYSEFTDYYKKK